jgi:MFS family permease
VASIAEGSVLGGALCLDALDVSMLGVVLPSIRSALGLSTSSLQWIVSGYVLGYGGLLLLGGRAADLLGRRRVFLVAMAAFALVSVFGGLVSSPGLLIAARFVKGAAAAFTAPASMSLLTTTFPEEPMRNRAFSIYTVFGASGFSLGLVLSGVLTEISWRWTLLVPAPVALAVLAAAVLLIRVASAAGEASAGSTCPVRLLSRPRCCCLSIRWYPPSMRAGNLGAGNLAARDHAAGDPAAGNLGAGNKRAGDLAAGSGEPASWGPGGRSRG